jgi:hypothetical protein
MKDTDQLIGKTLAGLRDTEAPTGMERRILETLENQALARSRWGWLTAFSLRISARPMAYAGALAGVVVLVLAIPAIHQRRQTSVLSAKAVPSAPLPPAPSTTLAASVEPQTPTIVTRPSRRAKPRRLEVTDPEEALAVREMNAPSRPAPPLPLTEQEKLLVRFVRTSTPEQLAAIDSAKWAAHDEQERTEFDRFFGRLPKEQSSKTHLVKGQPAREKPTEEALNKF